MSLPKNHLYNDEEVVIDMHPHWVFLVPRGAGLLASMVLGVWALSRSGNQTWITGVRWLSLVLVVAFLVTFLAKLIVWNSINFVVTTERCIYRSGVFRKTGIEIPLDRINTVFFNQNFLERLVHAGDIGIESAGQGSRQEFDDIYNPVNVQNVIYREMEEYENRKTSKLGAAVTGGGGRGGGQLSVAEQLEKLEELRSRGTITPEEFEAQKAKLLGS